MRGGSTIVLGRTEVGRAHEPPRARRACENAGLRARRFDGFAGGLAAFSAAFVVYARQVLAAAVATNPGVENFTVPVVTRIFFINLGAFAALLMLKVAEPAMANRNAAKTFASRLI